MMGLCISRRRQTFRMTGEEPEPREGLDLPG